MRTSARPVGRMMSISAMRLSGVATNVHESTASPKGKRPGEVLAESNNKVEESLSQKRVNENWRGYKSLVDKGSKVEAEQTRTDDSS